MSRITVKIDPGVCIAAAACVATEPAIFVLDEDNVAAILAPDGSQQHQQTLEVTAGQRMRILEAAQSCPTGAIGVVE